MNKTYLIVGGASVVSLAVGTTSGYFFAKRKFDATVDELIASEVEKTKKYYSVLLMEAKAGKPESPEDIRPGDEADEDLALEAEQEPEEELSEADKKVISGAKAAMVNYQGYAAKPDPSTVVESNIFTNGAPKKAVPPRDPTTGHFLPTKGKVAEKTREETPYAITQDEFLNNDPNHEQKNLRYFQAENTLIDVENNDEMVEIGRVGEVNLTLFPEEEEGIPRSICVRNEWLQEDYDIQLVTESLTDYMGLGDTDDSDQYELDEIHASQD